MTNRRRVQSINPKDPMALQKVIEALEVSEGVRGNPSDRKPTMAEVQQMIAGGGAVIQPGSGNSSGGGTGGGSGQTGSQVMPRVVSGIATITIQDGIVIGWTPPSYAGHGKTEVWRSATASLENASMIGITGGNSFVDYQAGNGQTWTYFLRNVVDVSLGTTTGPFSAGNTVTSAPANQVLTAANSYTNSQIASLSIIPDAPSDGKMYVRLNGSWVELPA